MFKNIMLALERIERRQRLILERLEELRAGQCPAPTGGSTDENRGPRKAGRLCGETTPAGVFRGQPPQVALGPRWTSGEVSEPCCMQQGEGYKAREDEWVQKGIDNILAYQVGKKRGEQA